MVEVIATDEFRAWYDELTPEEAEAVTRVADRLAEQGIGLRFPHTSAIRNSRHAMRELRPNKGQSPLRVFYAFDPLREAILLIGGDKSGESARRFYGRMVAQADAIFDQYLAEQAAGLHPGPADEED